MPVSLVRSPFPLVVDWVENIHQAVDAPDTGPWKSRPILRGSAAPFAVKRLLLMVEMILFACVDSTCTFPLMEACVLLY